MKHLVMKDMRLIGIMNLVILGTGILGGSIGMLGDEVFISNILYLTAIIAAWFSINNLIYSKELKSKSDALIISLPVNKGDIVKSRYLTMMIYIFATLSIIYLTSNIGKMLFYNMPGYPLSLLGMLIIGSIMIMLTAIYIPFQYYDHKSAQFFPMGILMLASGGPSIMGRLGIDLENLSFTKKALTMDFKTVGFILFGVALILYMLSLFVSRGIYQAKEF